MLLTKNNNRAFLNVAFAYTSTDEITNSIKAVTTAIQNDHLQSNDVDEEVISKSLYTNKSRDPDILIRTSGEIRFSDFLLWQLSDCSVWFTEVLWPEFSLWHLLATVFKYQRNINSWSDDKKHFPKPSVPKVQKYFEKLEEEREGELKQYQDS